MYSVLRLTVCLAISLLFFSYSAYSVEAGVEQLDVDISVFDPGIPADVSTHRRLKVFPLVRKAESRYLPFLLHQTLVASGQWGVVRVRAMTNGYQSSELLITGTIQQSNGEVLTLKIQAVDGAGRTWLDKAYTGTATEAGYQQHSVDPFQHVFDQIANDLLDMRATLAPIQLQHIAKIATLRYGAGLSPETFGEYLLKDEAGIYQVRRLPAENDPMLKRISRIREYEYLFIDTENEQYLGLFDEMKKTYDLWRQYNRELLVYIRNQATDAASDKHQFRRGSYASMKNVYENYAWFRRQEQYLEELSRGFNSEVFPTVMQLENSVINLSGDLENKYAQWQSILRSIFKLERGALPQSSSDNNSSNP